jgi:hypothetical protein
MFKQGLDLDKLTAKKNFSFVDGLDGIYVSQPQNQKTMKSTEQIIHSIRNAIRSLQRTSNGGKTILIIDQMDLLLALSGEELGPVQLSDILLDLREVCTRTEENEIKLNVESRRFIL